MKSIIVLLAVLLLATPAMANVGITAVAGPGPNDVTVGFNNGDAALVRAIALDVVVNDANIVIGAISCVDTNYGIYPGSISIDAGGNVTNWGTCAGAGMDSNTVATEQGSLYVGPANAPGQSGTLFIVTLVGCTQNTSGEAVVSITEDGLRGGVVMEDPELTPTVDLPGDVTVTGLPLCDAGCTCWADISGPSGVPDNAVSINDLTTLLGKLLAEEPYMSNAPTYEGPIPEGWDCIDISGPSGVPDSALSINDLTTLLGVLLASEPYMSNAPIYEGPCIADPNP
jgi:hypothetical protein